MTRLNTHAIFDEELRQIARVHPASPEAVATVLAASEDDEEGRSQFMWLRLANGDLMLGVFPQGGTYFGVEEES